MTCAEFVELVTAFLDGALDPDTENRFVERLALRPGCDTDLEQFRRTIDTLGERPPESLSEQTRNRLLAAFDDRHRSA